MRLPHLCAVMPIRYTLSAFFSFILLAFLASCDKKEKAITLPPAGSARFGRVDMGKDYDTMIYYDYERNAIVKTSLLNSWDIAFESSPEGRHAILNGGLNMQVLNTHASSFKDVKAVPAAAQLSDWHIDSPDGDPAGTGIGDWVDANGLSKGDVYIVVTGTLGSPASKLRKLKLLSVSAQQYLVQYGDMADTAGTTVTIPKVAACNYSYLSFKTGNVSPEPPKDTWDVVFTYYKELIYNPTSKLNDFPYVVSGVLLNPTGTAAAGDSTLGYAAINLDIAQTLPASAKRNTIGYDWKAYSGIGSVTAGIYTVNPRRVYILHSRNGHLIKLHFLDFYSPVTSTKGSPSFESEVIL